ncbi:MAG: hypothetical protein F4150_09330, partial [Chloroflexi bacterium]|nr:hypothetical protein [Chloroflexota bacterium]
MAGVGVSSIDGASPWRVSRAGIGMDGGLERIAAYVGGYGVPMRIVDVQVFAREGGSGLLIREVTGEETRPPRREGRSYTVDAIRQRAGEAGVEAPFDRLLAMVGEADPAARPHKLAVMIAPRANRTRYLMYARPEPRAILLSAGPAQLAAFVPPLTDATVAIGPYGPDHPPYGQGSSSTPASTSSGPSSGRYPARGRPMAPGSA